MRAQAIAGGIAAAVGLAIVARGMAMLQWAHRYMQQSNEGLAFVWTAVVLVIGGVIAIVGVCLLTIADKRAAAVGTTAALTLCAFAAFWVWAQGTNCIGPC